MWRLVLMYSVGIGLWLTVLNIVVTHLFVYLHIIINGRYLEDYWHNLLTIRVPISFGGGALGGLIVWVVQERRYRATLNKLS